jgi:hypothetical protein
MKIFYAGLELATTDFVICVVNQKGKVVFKREGKSLEAEILKAASEMSRQCQGDIILHVEVGDLVNWGRRLFKPFVKEIVVSVPRENHWIAHDPHKSDQHDANKLATLCRNNQFKKVFFHESEERREFKMVVQHYEEMTRETTRIKGLIKARLRAHDMIRKDSSVFHPDHREAVLSQIKGEVSRECMIQLFCRLDSAKELRQRALDSMKKMSKRFPEVKLLMGIPGIRIINACRFVAYVQDPSRFPTARALWGYARLGVVQPTSNGRPIGPKHLNQAGCGTLKDISHKTFRACQRRSDNNLFKRTYKESLERTHNDSHARLSVQRKVLAVMRAVWMTGTPYRDDLGWAKAAA